MLVSHAVKGKHLIFDGRLLHGAPAHRSLLRHGGCNRSEEDENISSSSLRVTLLVNIWLSGKPACVNVLPECIRSKVKCAATKSRMINERRMPMGFAKRHVSNISVRAGASTELNNDDDNTADEEMIILPFVSNGNAYTGVDNDADNGDIVEAQVDYDSEVAFTEVETSGGDNDTDKGSGTKSQKINDENDEDGTQDDDDEELFLVLSPFVIDDYTEAEADTFVLSFGDGNGAQIIRGDALEEISSRRHCPWKRFAASYMLANGRVGESRITDATVFLSYLRDNIPSFLTSVIEELTVRYEMDVTTHHADHVCYRTGSIEQYSRLVNALSAATNDFRLLTESVISGRPIATFKMTTPIIIKTAYGIRTLDVIEIPSPKAGSPYHSGLEHVEFVLGDGSHESPVNSEAHQIALTDWMSRYPSVIWNVKALDKACNPDTSTSFGIAKYGTVTVKFHLIPLEDVIKSETSTDNNVHSTSIAATVLLE
jgi:predicted metalloenzyme YecM